MKNKLLAAREPVPKSYPARSKAWRDYRDETRVAAVLTSGTAEIVRAAFVAGWEARKRAQYSGEAS
jgi:hypothetical protein